MRAIRLLPLIPFLCLSVSSAQAITFSDVPSSYMYRADIDTLVDKGVIVGFSDGTFRPSYPVSRAAMIKMIYKAFNVEPPAPDRICAKDVIAGHWAEPYICAALAAGYVQGIGSGNFGPDLPVTRAEGIKMILTIFKFDQTLRSVKDSVPPAFDDVKVGDWYYNYINVAFAKTILPVGGEDPLHFGPNTPLSRGEAAAYIDNALRAKTKEVLDQASSRSSSSSSSSAPSSAASSSSSSKAPTILKMTLPFNDTQTFDAKNPISYTFSLTATTTVDIISTVANGAAGSLTCRLYSLESSGFSTEYYFGYQDQGSCELLNTLTAGNYQLELLPSDPSLSFALSAKTVKGDNNDGFSQALSLDAIPVRTAALGVGNLQDFYKFSVPSTSSSGGQTMTLQLISTDQLTCLIYPLDNVDIFGFSEPTCNASYQYPAGNYMLAVSRDAVTTPKAKKEVYTIEMNK